MTNTTSNSIERLFLWIAALLACLALVGFVWMLHGWRELFGHILSSSGGNIAFSTSMEPFDISSKARLYDEKLQPLDQIVEWDVKVPRAYVTDLRGENGDVAHFVKDENGNSSWKGGIAASLALHVLEDGETIEPYTKMARDQQKFDDNTMMIGFGAGSAPWWYVKNDLCVPQDKGSDFSEKYDGDAGNNLDCFDSIKFCYFATHIDGWNLKVSVTKRLYKQPEKMCALAKKFMNQYTVKRDAYPFSEPIHYKRFAK